MINPPLRSPREKTGRLYHFGRMIDKIRLHLRSELPEDYQANFGQIRSLDGLLSGFLNLTHAAVVERVKQGGTDEEIWSGALPTASGLTKRKSTSGTVSPRSSAGMIP